VTKYQFYLNQQKDEAGRLVGMMDGYQFGHAMELADAGETYDPADPSDDSEVLEDLYETYNNVHPAHYRNRSMSVGDVVVLGLGDRVRAYAVDTCGFKKLDQFEFRIPGAVPKEIADAHKADDPFAFLKGAR